ncbi:MAG: MauE/DoxX family redox-associated membrane protein [Myxococcota bacterium]
MMPSSLDPALGFALRLALAGLWGLAVAHKAADPRAFRRAVADYRLVPAPLTGAAAWTLTVCEVALAATLLVPATSAAAALGSAALLGLYALAMGVNLARGRRDLDCGCSAPGRSRPLGEGLLVRNALLAALSLAAALPLAPRSLGWLDAITVAAGAVTLLLLHAGAEAALANAPRSRSLGRRAWSTH